MESKAPVSDWPEQLPFPYSFYTKLCSGMSVILNGKKKNIKYYRNKGDTASFLLHLREVKAYVKS